MVEPNGESRVQVHMYLESPGSPGSPGLVSVASVASYKSNNPWSLISTLKKKKE